MPHHAVTVYGAFPSRCSGSKLVLRAPCRGRAAHLTRNPLSHSLTLSCSIVEAPQGIPLIPSPRPFALPLTVRSAYPPLPRSIPVPASAPVPVPVRVCAPAVCFSRLRTAPCACWLCTPPCCLSPPRGRPQPLPLLRTQQARALHRLACTPSHDRTEKEARRRPVEGSGRQGRRERSSTSSSSSSSSSRGGGSCPCCRSALQQCGAVTRAFTRVSAASSVPLMPRLLALINSRSSGHL